MSQTDDVVATLLLPFDKGLIETPDARCILFLGAAAAPALDTHWRARLLAETDWRPDCRALNGLGIPAPADLNPDDPPTSFPIVLVRLEKDRAANLGRIAEGWERLAEGGTLVVAGAKDEGAQTIEKVVAGLHPLAGSLPKHGCRVFWLTKADASPAFTAALDGWLADTQPSKRVEGRFYTQPGLFSADRIDPGSAFLAQHLPTDIKGDVADFGCGWGYLSSVLYETRPAIRTLTCIDAHFRAVGCSELNVGHHEGYLRLDDPARKMTYMWADLTQPLDRSQRFNWVVTNPPFHAGKAGDPGIGQRFIETAHAALKPFGHLILVANKHLPYEATLKRLFGNFQQVAEDRSYKILMARR